MKVNTATYYRNITIMAMLLISAVITEGCGGRPDGKVSLEKMITQESHDLVMIESKNGLKKYLFDTPLMEFYEFAAEPYREFRKGIYVETYQDSTEVIESILKADYALYYENQKLWFASGNVITESHTNEQTLYTEQLFWNQRTGKIYSYVDGIIVDKDGLPIKFTGIESDEQFTDVHFTTFDGALPVESAPKERAERPNRDSLPATDANPTLNVVTTNKPIAPIQNATAITTIRNSRNESSNSIPIQRNTIGKPSLDRTPIQQTKPVEKE